MTDKLYLAQYEIKTISTKHGIISNSIRLRLIESTSIESAKLKLYEYYKDITYPDFLFELNNIVITEKI